MATTNVILSRLIDKGSTDLKQSSTQSSSASSSSWGTAANKLTEFAVLLRALQLFAHNAHNLASGPSFFADHDFLGEAYEEYTEAYDSVVELIIGDSGPGSIDLLDTHTKAVGMVSQMSEDGESFPVLYRGEALLQSSVNNIAMGNSDQGALQVIGSIAEKSKKRRYKIGQRIKP